MRITRYTDYSLRVLMYVAVREEGELSTIGEVAKAYNISKNHLMKVVQELTSIGHLHAVRGKNGGIRLNRDPKDINIGALVRRMEQDLALVECFGSSNQCVITPACQLKNVLAEAMEAFFATLDKYTLADLLPPARQKDLQNLLGVVKFVDAAAGN